MFSFFKNKPQLHLFKVTYCTSALIDMEKKNVTFDLQWMNEKYVVAKDDIDAQVAFARENVLYPHVYIHKIEKMKQVNG